ncbi:DJ-1/PfpI family protein [Salinisphaera sp.]|uniref:DJ-1/PfpI family protein n=1 Tax=Salinisphaera sp. TaxID=1914330 RepID=UPI000C64C3FE|nr:DJ-1/PfpI family protein [Salinisphaera sp.]MBS63055.1 glutamine amidotransferase [Salinisphaera sp.]
MEIGIYIYEGAEVLDFSGPYEVFTTATRLGDAHLQPRLVAATSNVVNARGGFRVVPDDVLGSHAPLDVLIVAGGEHESQLQRPETLAALHAAAKPARVVASVCTGAFLLAATGLLDGRSVTTHWEDQAMLADRFPALTVQPDQRWVQDGRYVTSGGISAGIDMSLYLVAKLADPALARRTARQMEYRWLDASA